MLFNERARAESFGNVAELYDRARPSYPPALIDALLESRPRRVLDVGCGTGIAGALLAARGCKVLGVEVDPRMAALARRRGLNVEVAALEQWDAAERKFDLAICAQAWHWIEPRAGLARIAQVLPAGARIGLFWNFGDLPETVAARLGPIYARLEPGARELLGAARPLPRAHRERARRRQRLGAVRRGARAQLRLDAHVHDIRLAGLPANPQRPPDAPAHAPRAPARRDRERPRRARWQLRDALYGNARERPPHGHGSLGQAGIRV